MECSLYWKIKLKIADMWLKFLDHVAYILTLMFEILNFFLFRILAKNCYKMIIKTVSLHLKIVFQLKWSDIEKWCVSQIWNYTFLAAFGRFSKNILKLIKSDQLTLPKTSSLWSTTKGKNK